MQIITCTTATNPCPEANQHLMDSTMSELLINGGFDAGSFEVAFVGVLLLWVTGFGIGLIIGQVRKLRAPT